MSRVARSRRMPAKVKVAVTVAVLILPAMSEAIAAGSPFTVISETSSAPRRSATIRPAVASSATSSIAPRLLASSARPCDQVPAARWRPATRTPISSRSAAVAAAPGASSGHGGAGRASA